MFWERNPTPESRRRWLRSPHRVSEAWDVQKLCWAVDPSALLKNGGKKTLEISFILR